MVSKAMILIWMRRKQRFIEARELSKKLLPQLEDMRHDIEVLSEDFNAE